MLIDKQTLYFIVKTTLNELNQCNVECSWLNEPYTYPVDLNEFKLKFRTNKYINKKIWVDLKEDGKLPIEFVYDEHYQKLQEYYNTFDENAVPVYKKLLEHFGADTDNLKEVVYSPIGVIDRNNRNLYYLNKWMAIKFGSQFKLGK